MHNSNPRFQEHVVAIKNLKLSSPEYYKYLALNANSIHRAVKDDDKLNVMEKTSLLTSLNSKMHHLTNRSYRFFFEDHTIKNFSNEYLEVQGVAYNMLGGQDLEKLSNKVSKDANWIQNQRKKNKFFVLK